MDNEMQEVLEQPGYTEEQLAQRCQLAAEEARQDAYLTYAIRGAVASSGTVDPEIMELLLQREGLTVEGAEVPGLREAAEKIRKERPYLFADMGGRPRFSAETMDRLLSADDETVAERYKGNPWYKRR